MAEPETLILTRPLPQSEAFAAALAREMPGRFAVLVAPLIAIAPVPGAIDLAGLQGILFSSANGVEQFAARQPARDLPAYCVGDMTAAAARAAGFAARSADGDVDDLAAMVIAAHRPGAGAFLHVRGRHAAGDLVGRLAAAGVPARAAGDLRPGAAPDRGPGAGAARRRRARRGRPLLAAVGAALRGAGAGRGLAARSGDGGLAEPGGRRRARRPRVRPPAGGADAGAGRDAPRARVGSRSRGVNPPDPSGVQRCDAAAGGHRLVPPGGLA